MKIEKTSTHMPKLLFSISPKLYKVDLDLLFMDGIIPEAFELKLITVSPLYAQHQHFGFIARRPRKTR